MKLTILTIAATVGFAIAAPNFSAAQTGETPKTGDQPPVKQAPNKGPKLSCAKPELVKGKPVCPPAKGAVPK